MARNREPLLREATPAAIEAAAAAWFARRDAGLNAEEERSLAGWLTADPRHAEAFARLDSAWATFGKPARAGEADSLLAELASRTTRRRRTRLFAATAAVLLLAGLGAVIAPWRGGGRELAPSLAVVHSPRQQTLPDGSTVTLREGASIAVDFSPTQRRIALERGEALFEVQKDQARPFVVVTKGVAVRAVGTAFTVQAGAGAVDVLVTEGVVSIAPAAGGVAADLVPAPAGGAESAGLRPVTVTAGHRLMVESLSGARPLQSEAVRPDEIDRRLSWRAPRVEFSGMPLAEAVALLNREAAGRTATRLHIVDAGIAHERVSGVFRTDNLEAFLFLLETGFGIKATREGGSVMLSRAPQGERSP